MFSSKVPKSVFKKKKIGECGRVGVGRMEWSEGGKWDNCNSIINKYIKKKIKTMNIKTTYHNYQQLNLKNKTTN